MGLLCCIHLPTPFCTVSIYLFDLRTIRCTCLLIVLSVITCFLAYYLLHVPKITIKKRFNSVQISVVPVTQQTSPVFYSLIQY